MKINFFHNRSISELIKIDSEQLPYTYLEGYKDFMKANYGTSIVIGLSEEKDVFVILSLHKNKFITNAQLLSELFTNTGALPVEKQEDLFVHLTKALSEQKIADRIITPQNFVILGAAPKNSAYCKFGSYVVDLTTSSEELYNNVHAKHRNKINKAQKAGVVIKAGKDQLEVFYKLYLETMNRSNMFCESLAYFESLYLKLGEKNCYCAVAYHNNSPQGAILAPYTKYCCYYIYGASSGNITESGSINYLHWHTFLKMKEVGVKRYDFVGARLSDVSNSKLEGIQSFKERFGGTLKKGFLFKMDLNKTKCNLFDSLLKVNNTLKGKNNFKDIIDQENEKRSA